MTEEQRMERRFLSAYTLRGIGIDVGCGKDRFEGDNIVGIDKYVPADRVLDFEMINHRFEVGKYDFIIMSHYLRFTRDVILNLKKAVVMLKEGGFLLIAEDQDRDASAPAYYNYNEMEGLLMLYEDYIHIEQRGFSVKNKYYYIARKKGELNEQPAQ